MSEEDHLIEVQNAGYKLMEDEPNLMVNEEEPSIILKEL